MSYARVYLRQKAAQGTAIGMGLGVVFGLAMPFIMLATGQTFGQRCTTAGYTEPAAHAACVSRLSQGGVE